jgi:hypothetical protein
VGATVSMSMSIARAINPMLSAFVGLSLRLLLS